MNARDIQAALDAAGIEYRKETFFSNFWGTRFVFKGEKLAAKVEKLLPAAYVKPYFSRKEWCIETCS